jgi:hypothetical protein
MKKFLVVLACFFNSCTLLNKDSIIIHDRIILVKDIHVGEIFKYKIPITNKGSNTISIKNVVGDCGCINLSWPHDPILPDSTAIILGSIKISDTIAFKKNILIYTNSDSSFYSIAISGKGIL